MKHLGIMTLNTIVANCSRGHIELKIHVKTLGQGVEDCKCDWSSSVHSADYRRVHSPLLKRIWAQCTPLVIEGEHPRVTYK